MIKFYDANVEDIEKVLVPADLDITDVYSDYWVELDHNIYGTTGVYDKNKVQIIKTNKKLTMISNETKKSNSIEKNIQVVYDCYQNLLFDKRINEIINE